MKGTPVMVVVLACVCCLSALAEDACTTCASAKTAGQLALDGAYVCNESICPASAGDCHFRSCCGPSGSYCRYLCDGWKCLRWTWNCFAHLLECFPCPWFALPPCCLEWTSIWFECYDPNHIPTYVTPKGRPIPLRVEK